MGYATGHRAAAIGTLVDESPKRTWDAGDEAEGDPGAGEIGGEFADRALKGDPVFCTVELEDSSVTA